MQNSFVFWGIVICKARFCIGMIGMGEGNGVVRGEVNRGV